MRCIRGCEDPMATHLARGPPVLCTWGTSVQPALPVGCAGRMRQRLLCETVCSCSGFRPESGRLHVRKMLRYFKHKDKCKDSTLTPFEGFPGEALVCYLQPLQTPFSRFFRRGATEVAHHCSHKVLVYQYRCAPTDRKWAAAVRWGFLTETVTGSLSHSTARFLKSMSDQALDASHS